jgi:hypothetical protein
VDETLDARLEFDERAVRNEIDDLPWILEPTGNLWSMLSHGCLLGLLEAEETRSFSRLMSMIITSISSPCFSISDGWPMRPQLMSVMCSKPSMPSRSMNAP